MHNASNLIWVDMEMTGLDEKTIRRGRRELEDDLQECPLDQRRRGGAGRPTQEKSSLAWRARY